MSNTLHLNLKRQWYDLILSGEKKEEYRTLNNYWVNRLKEHNARVFNRVQFTMHWDLYHSFSNEAGYFEELNRLFQCCCRDFYTITFSNGYAKNRDQFVIEFKGVEIKEGRQDWGAKEGEKYFAIQLGEIISANNSQLAA